MSDVMLADAWLTGALQGLAPGGAWADVAPLGVAMPFIVVTLSEADDVKVMGGVRVFTDMTYQVKAVARGGPFSALSEVMDAVDGVLDASYVPVEGGMVLWCERLRPFRYTESSSGEVYRHLGAYYRVVVREEQ